MDNFLLLNYDTVNDFDRVLYKVLTTSINARIRFRQETIRSNKNRRGKNEPARIIADFQPDLLFLIVPSQQLSTMSSMLKSLERSQNAPPVIVITEDGEPSDLLELLKCGAADFITPPLNALNIIPRIERLLRQTRDQAEPLRRLKNRFALNQLIGESPAFLSVIKRLPIVARCDVNILVSGETGTGKELCARAIHYLSPRADQAFVPINCGAIPVELVENELFGHSRGAYTSAVEAQNGLVAEADGGTLFLDEVDSLFPPAQVKLLRFLQEKEYRPIGSTKTRRADVRVIAAANIDFEEAVKSGRLRKDLYYRLNVIPLQLPPLRERREDILPLARHFLRKYAAEFGKGLKTFSEEAIDLLIHYDWPGNVREVENAVERAVVLSENENILDCDLGLPDQSSSRTCKTSFQEAKAQCVAEFERVFISKLLVDSKGNITQAARIARKDRRSFWQLIQKHHIDVSKIKTKSIANAQN